MGSKVIHKLIVKDGAYIELPPWSGLTGAEIANLAHPDVYEAAHAMQKYPIETIFRDCGRTFVYGKWSATTTIKTAGYGVCTVATFKALTDAGISGTSGGSTLVVNYGGSCAAHKYAGGYLGMKGSQYRSWRIIDNSIQDASNYVTFTVDGTLQANIATGDDFTLMENPYGEMRWYITEDSRPYIGVTVSTIVASYYAWLQTWGVHMMGAAFNSWEGADGNQFGIWFYHGSFQGLPANTSLAISGGIMGGGCQQAGWMAAGSDPSSPADVSHGYPVYLTIRP